MTYQHLLSRNFFLVRCDANTKVARYQNVRLGPGKTPYTYAIMLKESGLAVIDTDTREATEKYLTEFPYVPRTITRRGMHFFCKRPTNDVLAPRERTW